jgi:FkbM family methyltransferase
MSVVAKPPRGGSLSGVISHPLHIARRSALFRGLNRWLDFPAFRKVAGLSFPICLRFGPNLRTWISGRATEVVELELFGRLIEATEATQFVDVGANVGIYSFWFASRRPQGRVLTLEPDPANVRCLMRTIRRWQLSGIDVRPVAASDHKGRAVFQFDDVAGVTGQLKSGTTSFGERHYGVQPREDSVEVDTLDEIVGDGRPDIIKIDVEGAEASVLRGTLHVLRDARPCLLLELGEGRESSTDILQNAGYALYDARDLGSLREETWNALALPVERASLSLDSLRTAGR